MIYKCSQCKFIFERRADTILCPNCGKYSVSEADEEAKEQYLKLQEQQKTEKNEKTE